MADDRILSPSPATVKTPADRRAHVRYSTRIDASCCAAESDQADVWQASVREISAGGIRLLLGKQVEQNGLLSIQLLSGCERPLRLLQARVRHAKRVLGGQWMVGCEFVNKLSEQELRALVGPSLENGNQMFPNVNTCHLHS
jgi:c-di-GMP-binding flagellar brake protein YcgR